MSFRQEFWSGKKLCSQEDLKSNSATEIILRDGEQLCSVIVVNFENDLRVFYNSCPHARLPLNIKKDKFFDISGRYLFCSSHGAFFRPSDGFCFRGPCRGQALTQIVIAVEEGNLVIV